MWLIILSDQLPVVALVSRYLANKLIGRELLHRRDLAAAFTVRPGDPTAVRGITRPLDRLSPTDGQIAHVLRTRSPLTSRASPTGPYDLHVLSTPPAFVLSQDQTLRWKVEQALRERLLSSRIKNQSFIPHDRPLRLSIKGTALSPISCRHQLSKSDAGKQHFPASTEL